MKEVVVLSGKGGTGKTSLTACFAVLSTNSVIVDCDVDAANLFLVLAPESEQRFEFVSGVEAKIQPERCVSCLECMNYCRFDAIQLADELSSQAAVEVVDGMCEGCGTCAVVCPYGAIELKDRSCGYWYTSETRAGSMVFARLNPGDENSGRLVSLVRQEVRSIGEAQGAEVVLIDGPPGIACPAIASLTGTSLVVFVAEPSKSGLHDLKRAIELAKSFNIPTGVCVNRWDINPEITVEIESFAEHAGAFLLGRVPYDEGIVHAQLNKLTAVEVDSSAAPAIREVWGNVCRKGGINEQGTI